MTSNLLNLLAPQTTLAASESQFLSSTTTSPSGITFGEFLAQGESGTPATNSEAFVQADEASPLAASIVVQPVGQPDIDRAKLHETESPVDAPTDSESEKETPATASHIAATSIDFARDLRAGNTLGEVSLLGDVANSANGDGSQEVPQTGDPSFVDTQMAGELHGRSHDASMPIQAQTPSIPGGTQRNPVAQTLDETNQATSQVAAAHGQPMSKSSATEVEATVQFSEDSGTASLDPARNSELKPLESLSTDSIVDDIAFPKSSVQSTLVDDRVDALPVPDSSAVPDSSDSVSLEIATNGLGFEAQTVRQTNIPVATIEVSPATGQSLSNNLASHVQDAVRTVVVNQTADRKSMRVEIRPPDLGHMTIQVDQSSDQIVAEIIASEVMTAEMLIHEKDFLLEALSDLGFTDAQLDIRYGNDPASDQGEFEGEQAGTFGQASLPVEASDLTQPNQEQGVDLIV